MKESLDVLGVVICIAVLAGLAGYAAGRAHASSEKEQQELRSGLADLRFQVHRMQHPEPVPEGAQ
jgi:hypothetical protein